MGSHATFTIQSDSTYHFIREETFIFYFFLFLKNFVKQKKKERFDFKILIVNFFFIYLELYKNELDYFSHFCFRFQKKKSQEIVFFFFRREISVLIFVNL